MKNIVKQNRRVIAKIKDVFLKNVQEQSLMQPQRLFYRIRIVILPIIVLMISIIILVVSYRYGTQQSFLNVQRTYHDRLIVQEKEQWLQQTVSEANILDQIIRLSSAEVYEIAGFIKSISNCQGSFLSNVSPVFDLIVSGGELNRDEIIQQAKVFFPKRTVYDDAVMCDVLLSTGLDFVVPNIVNSNQDLVAFHFATPRNVVYHFPQTDLRKALPVEFEVTESVWYQDSLTKQQGQGIHLSIPDNGLINGGNILSISMPVLNDSADLLGVAGIELSLQSLQTYIPGNDYMMYGYSFLIDSKGKIINSADQNKDELIDQYREVIQDSTQLPILLKSMPDEAGSIELNPKDGKGYTIFYAPISRSGLAAGKIIDNEVLMADLDGSSFEPNFMVDQVIFNFVLPVLAIVLILISLFGVVTRNNAFSSVERLIESVNGLKNRMWDVDIPLNGPAEIGTLAAAFSDMRDELHIFITHLETSIDTKTETLIGRKQQIQTASSIARDVLSTRNLDVIFKRTINLLLDRFGFYHVGIYLIDQNDDYAVLQAATGDLGAEMIEQGHRLKIGPASIVGTVAYNGEPRIAAMDIAAKTHQFVSPFLHRSKSQLVLPLVVRQRIIGVLDIHDDKNNAFDLDDLNVFQSFADQLAVAIDMAWLDLEYREMKQQFESLNIKIGRDIFKNAVRTSQVIGYEYDRSGLKSILRDTKQSDEKAPFSLPITIRGEQLAWLEIWPVGQELDPNDLYLLDLIRHQLNLAVERAYVADETHIRQGQEYVVNDFVSKLSNSIDMDGLLKMAANYINSLPNIADVAIQIHPPHVEETS